MDNYQTKWVQTLPEIGVECPGCRQGFIESNNFTSKKGESFQSVKCKNCRTKWILSQYPSEDKEVSPHKTIPKEITVEAMTLKELQKINERLDKLGEYLKEKIERKFDTLLEDKWEKIDATEGTGGTEVKFDSTQSSDEV